MTGDQNPAPGPAPGVPIKVTPEILLQVLTTPPSDRRRFRCPRRPTRTCRHRYRHPFRRR